MNTSDADRIPVIIGVGQVNDRPAKTAKGLESRELMLSALKLAERDAGASVLGRLDWMGVEDQISFPDPEIHRHLADLLSRRPPQVVRTHEASGDGPVKLINDAANLIGRGVIRIAACVGGEALRTAAQNAKAAPNPGGNADRLAEAAQAGALPLARQYGLFTPADVYPFYENGTRAAWKQTLAEAQRETAQIWSGFSKTASENPHAWLQKPVTADAILERTADNRMISFPYTKLMVANSSVNQGAAVIVASLAAARELGIPEHRLVFVGAGASSHEADDFLMRENYVESVSLAASIKCALDFNALQPSQIDHLELYSCFPCVPKMARRQLNWPLDRPHSVYGGLTFGGGPIGNCMMHAAAAMVEKIRNAGGNGLIVANGGFATHNHSIVLTARMLPAGTFPQNYDVQSAADARRGKPPTLLERYSGPATIETYNVPYDRQGLPIRATIIARTPAGERFVAAVEPGDESMLHFLTCGDLEPVGSRGHAKAGADGRNIWSSAAAA
jgi:acetyl-CoA C-acetyltransferase